MTPLIAVVLYGGAGTWLWPVSSEALPKPFMRLPNGRSLLRRTVERAAALPVARAALILTCREYDFLSRDELAGACTGGRSATPAGAGRLQHGPGDRAGRAGGGDPARRTDPDDRPAGGPPDGDEPDFRRAVRQAQAVAADG
jgi:hypothetical protein